MQEPASGIYIVNIPTRKVQCEKELKMVAGNAKVCVPRKPIIDIGEIDYITEIRYNPQLEAHYIDIGFTSSGMQMLNKMVDALVAPKFALVIEDNVICTFSGTKGYSINSIRIGEDATLPDLEKVHFWLEKIKH